eukprot:m.155254 g.155254  ORF g.155254 m.155254 type:complete len:317 (+) comp24654_c0_seq10:208-1158(+)
MPKSLAISYALLNSILVLVGYDRTDDAGTNGETKRTCGREGPPLTHTLWFHTGQARDISMPFFSWQHTKKFTVRKDCSVLEYFVYSGKDYKEVGKGTSVWPPSMDHEVMQLTPENVNLNLLEAIYQYLETGSKQLSNTGLGFVVKNLNKAIFLLLREILETQPWKRRLAFFTFGDRPWFCKLAKTHLSRNKDEDEYDSDPETYFIQNVSSEHVGKPPQYACRKCAQVLAGLVCRSSPRPQGNVFSSLLKTSTKPADMGATTCDTLMVLQEDGSAKCPKGCGQVTAPSCCNRCMVGKAWQTELTIPQLLVDDAGEAE